jgi:hypothetical protein
MNARFEQVRADECMPPREWWPTGGRSNGEIEPDR